MTTNTLIRPPTVAAGTAVATPVTATAILLAASAIIQARLPGQPAWTRFHNMEGKPDDEQRALLLTGTPLQAIADAATQLGAPLTEGDTKPTVVHVVDRGIMTLKQAHAFSCDCGHAISDADAAGRMRDIANSRPDV